MCPAEITEPIANEIALISHAELLVEMAQNNVRVLDVLPAVSYAQHHIPGAISAPLAGLQENIEALYPNRTAPLVVYCSGYT